MRIFAHLGDKGGNRIVMKFCVQVGVPDIITHANFGNDRFRVFGGAGVEFPTFSLTYAVALKTLWHYRVTTKARNLKFGTQNDYKEVYLVSWRCR